MPGGRPRKPIAAKQLDGTYRKDRDGAVAEAVQAPGTPAPPEWLSGEALAFWQAVVPDLVVRRVAAACDAPELARMCWWYGRLRHFMVLLESTPDAAPGLYVQAGICSDKFERSAGKFGLNPSDRARLKADPAAPRAGVASRKR